MRTSSRREFLLNSAAAAASFGGAAALAGRAGATTVLQGTVLSDNNPLWNYGSSDRGSDRGSGYMQSNPILRHNSTLFATWQNYDPNTGKFIVYVGTKNPNWTKVALPDPSLVWGGSCPGCQMDNHGVGSIVADAFGYLHVFYGPHHQPMLEAVSTAPWNAAAFTSTIVPTGAWPNTTYSSVVRDSGGKLHFVFRGRDSLDRYRLVYQNGTPNSSGQTTWNLATQKVLAVADSVGYSLYDAAIAIDSGDALHLAYQLYKKSEGYARTWGYLRSNNAGANWLDASGADVTTLLPMDATVAKRSHLVEYSPFMDARVCNVAIDPSGKPWVSVCYIAPPGRSAIGGYDTKLWRLNGGQWSTISLSAALMNARGPCWRVALASIAFDANGVLYVAADVIQAPDNTPDAWFAGGSKEVVVMVSTDMGQTFAVNDVSVDNAWRGPRWLANIERPTTGALLSNPPAFLYTDGPPNSPPIPGPVGTNKPTDIVFVQLV